MSSRTAVASAVRVAKTVRLGDLDYDPVVLKMPGQVARLERIDDLKASIASEGVLQSLKVRLLVADGAEGARHLAGVPTADSEGRADSPGPRYLVSAGLRRLTTLRWLRDNGGEIAGAPVTDDTEVPVVLGGESDADARRQAVAENVQRVALTPMAEARQFAELAREMGPKDIATRFGVKKRFVEQRMKLAALHPDVQAAFEAGAIKLDAAEAFTLEPDPARQATYLRESADKPWMLNAHQIRRNFEAELVSSDSATAKLIGKEAYLAAGGEVMADSFADGGPSWWISHQVIRKLLDAHWSAQRQLWAAEGWAWIAEAGEYGDRCRHGGLGYDGALTSEFGRGEGGVHTAEQMAYCGLIYWESGAYPTKVGVIDPAKAAPPKAEAETAAEAKPVASLADPGNSVLQDLAARLTRALRKAVFGDTTRILALIHAALASQSFAQNDNPAGINSRVSMGKGDDAPDFATALSWAADQAAITLIDKIAELAAPSLAVGQWAMVGDAGAALLRMLDPDATAEFDADDYFASVRKPIIALAWEDMTGDRMRDAKKGEMAAQAAAKARETGWLPPQLRGPRYPGPGLSFAQLQAEREAELARREAERLARLGGEVAAGAEDARQLADGDFDEEFEQDELDELEAAE